MRPSATAGPPRQSVDSGMTVKTEVLSDNPTIPSLCPGLHDLSHQQRRRYTLPGMTSVTAPGHFGSSLPPPVTTMSLPTVTGRRVKVETFQPLHLDNVPTSDSSSEDELSDGSSGALGTEDVLPFTHRVEKVWRQFDVRPVCSAYPGHKAFGRRERTAVSSAVGSNDEPVSRDAFMQFQERMLAAVHASNAAMEALTNRLTTPGGPSPAGQGSSGQLVPDTPTPTGQFVVPVGRAP